MSSPNDPLLDLDAESRRALEFDELLAWLGGFARSPMGAERVRGSSPSADAAAVGRELEATAEACRHLVETGRLVDARLPDPTFALAALRVVDLRIDALALRELAGVLTAATRLGPRLLGLERDDFPRLCELGRRLPDLSVEARAVLAGTDERGRVLDDASPELRRVRVALGQVAERLRRMLRRSLHEPGSELMIRDDFITQRNDRFVIPVRTDAPKSIRGIVHASSSSGATRFVEPLESVELNNERVRLAEQERDEQERVLARWADSFRARGVEVDRSVATLARVDELQARALFAEDIGGSIPRVVEGGPLRIDQLRHALLDRRLRMEGGRCVPATLALDPADQVLVLSGPNTGGKTVVLKTVGLAVLMAQCGIPLPARSAELPLYRQVRADIGDHQSIAADLSTYSAHIGAVVEFLRAPAAPALFLFDEIGTGTEPTEGAALALSILEALMRPGLTTLVTTHLGALKSWSITTEGSSCAAMEFDTESLCPTYRILPGTAGISAGLDIAQRLGLDESIVRRARGRIDPETRRSEELLRRLRETLAGAESEREELRTGQEALLEQRRRLDDRTAREDERQKRKGGQELERILERFRRAAARELGALGQPAERASMARRLHRAEKRLAQDKARGRAELEGNDVDRTAAGSGLRSAPAVGTRVRVRSLGREGVVASVRGSVVEVRLGQVGLRTRIDNLAAATGGDADAEAPSSGGTSWRAGVSAAGMELKLVGLRVEEALRELDRFIDSARLAGHEEIRVIHGHGTGRLRSAVREFLEGHAQVLAVRAGGSAEGGDGATIARLS